VGVFSNDLTVKR